MNKAIRPAIAGVMVAITITTAMDATGFSVFSALPLIALFGLFWFLQKFSRNDIGINWSDLGSYGWALAYPLIVLGLAAGIAFAAGAVDTSSADWKKIFINMGVASSVGILMVMITEEGFFRGWLWASLKRAGKSDKQVLVWTTLAFIAWHVSAISLETGFDLPAKEIPIFLINGTLLGAIWGVLRLVSGSIVVPAVSHAVWNAIDYPLFGFGEKVGALGIEQTHIYGPEVGILGIALNLAFLTLLWRIYATRVSKITPDFH